MYKKAGIVIAILLLVAGIFVLSVSNCNKDGGIHIEQTTNNDTDNNALDKDSGEDVKDQHEGFVRKDNDENVEDTDRSKLDYVSEAESSIEDNSVEEKSDVESSSADSSVEESSEGSYVSEVSDSSAVDTSENSNVESSVSNSEVSKHEDEISTDVSTGVLRYKEINENELPEKASEKKLIGIITGKEILKQDNNIYMTILILDENQDVYRYYVPYSAYEGLEKGTKVEITVIVYMDSESKVSYKQVASVVVAE